MNNIRKHRQTIRDFKFLCGESLDIEISYESYGRLNESGDNAILICHFWTGTSHAAGKYACDDPLPGWWDELIGPGKTIDTDLNFVICTDTLSNVQAYEQDFNLFIQERASFADANAFLAIGKAATLHDVGLGRGGFEKALSTVQAEVLMIPNEQDIYFPAIDSRDVVDAIKAGHGNAELYPVDSQWGHFACLFDTSTFSQRLRQFLYQ